MPFTTVNAGDEILAEHITELQGALTGTASAGEQVQLIDYSSADNYSLTVKNPGSGGKAVRILASDGAEIGLFNDSSVVIKSKDGTDYITVSNSGVAITGAFSINGQTVGAGRTVFNVLDYGLTQGTTSAPASANTTALIALAVVVAAAGGGTIYFPEGTYPLNATSLDHNLGSSSSISLEGEYGASALYFFGASGPFLDLGDGASHALHRCGIRNLSIFHGEAVTSGGTIRIGANCTQVELDNVDFLDSGLGLPLICVDVVSGVTIRRSKLLCKNDASAVNVRVVETTTSVVFIYESDLSGTHGVTTGVQFSGAGLNDGTLIADSYIKDHAIGIRSGANVGEVANLKVSDCVLDVLDIGVAFQPVTGAAYSSLDFDNVWVSADTHGYLFNESNGGTVDDLAIHGGRITDVETCAIEVLDGIDGVIISGVRIHGTAIDGAAEAGIDIGAGATSPTNVIIANNIVKVAGTAAASIRINSNVAVVGVVGNLSRGVDVSFGGAVGTARVYQANANPFAA